MCRRKERVEKRNADRRRVAGGIQKIFSVEGIKKMGHPKKLSVEILKRRIE